MVVAGAGFVLSHPRRKNKDAPWMGHPSFVVGERAPSWANISRSHGGLVAALMGGLWRTGPGAQGLKPGFISCGVAAVGGESPTYQSSPDTRHASWGSWFPTLATKTKAWRGWGTLGRGGCGVRAVPPKAQKQGRALDGAPDVRGEVRSRKATGAGLTSSPEAQCRSCADTRPSARSGHIREQR